MTEGYKWHIYSEPAVHTTAERECVKRTVTLHLTRAREALESLRYRNQIVGNFVFPPNDEDDPRTLAFHVLLAILLLPVSLLLMLLATVHYVIKRGDPTGRRAMLKYDVDQLLAGKLPDCFAEDQRNTEAVEDMVGGSLSHLTSDSRPRLDGTLWMLWAHYGIKETVLHTGPCIDLLSEWLPVLYGSAAPTKNAIKARVHNIAKATAKGRAALLEVPGVMGVTLRYKPVTDVVATLSCELGPY